MDSSEIFYEQADLGTLKEMLEVFSEVFDEPQTYQGAVPSDRYLESLMGDGNFIAVAAVIEIAWLADSPPMF